jgi:hypothetical protein
VKKVPTNTSCPFITVAASSDQFINFTPVDFPNDCTVHDVAVTYEPIAQRFVMLYVRRSQTPAQDNVIVARSASASSVASAVVWTAPQDLGIVTLDAPGIACSNGTPSQCILTYIEANQNTPVFTTRFISISGTGQVALGSTSTSTAGPAYWKTIPAAIRTFGGQPEYVVTDNWPGDDWPNWSNNANGFYDIGSLHKTSVPLSWTGSDYRPVIHAYHRAALAALPTGLQVYAFYVR